MYNLAIQDARKLVQQRLLILDEEMEPLEKSTSIRNGLR
jgi:uncharacterized protein (DUF2164 family)